MLPPDDTREKLTWTAPIATSIEAIIRRRGQPTCVLASGDPMCYGIGVTLTRSLSVAEMTIVPAPSAFSLACARLGWSLTDVETLSLCGRDPALLHAVCYPGARLLVLSAGQHTPAIVAEQLTQRGFGQSHISILERMGGAHERRLRALRPPGTPWKWQICIPLPFAALLTLGLPACRVSRDYRIRPITTTDN